MLGRLPILAIGLVTDLLLAWALPGLPQLLLGSGASAARRLKSKLAADAGVVEEAQGVAKLSDEAIEAAGIEWRAVGSGTIAHQIIVPGTIVPHADRIAHVAVKLPSIVTELRKKIGDRVEKDEVLAVLESREVADAKSEYLAAR